MSKEDFEDFLNIDDLNLEIEDEDDVFTGSLDPSLVIPDHENTEHSDSNEYIVDNADDVNSADDVDSESDSDFILDDSFLDLEDQDFEEDEEDSEDEDFYLSNYQNSFESKPELPEAKKEPEPKKTKSERELNSDDLRTLLTQETIKGVDLIDTDKVAKSLDGTHKNRVTKGRDYNRKNSGILSDAQIRYFTSLSTTNLSNARYPDEYMNLVRSNEELLDHSERVHKKTITRLVSHGVKQDARDKIPKYVDTSIKASDEVLLEILAKLKYASTRQLSRAIGRSYEKTREALRMMQIKGLVKAPDSPYYDQKLWCVTSMGMVFSNQSLTVPDMSGVSVAMLQHTTVVNNVAAYIHSGSVNILDEENFPPLGRKDRAGRAVHGEDFVSETQIRSALGRVTSSSVLSGEKGDVYIPLLGDEIDDKFSRWERLRRDNPHLNSPEMEMGNEHMWVLFPPPRIGIMQHIPDLVIPRKRNKDGSPESIAVEVELKSKSLEDYVRTHKAYTHDKRMFKKVIWICSKKSTASLITKAAEEEQDLWDDNRIDILPIVTENGVFKGSNVLALG